MYLMCNKSAPFSLRVSVSIYSTAFISMLICKCVRSTSEMLFEFAPWFTNQMSTFARIMVKHVQKERKITVLFKHSHRTAAHSYSTKEPVKEKIMEWILGGKTTREQRIWIRIARGNLKLNFNKSSERTYHCHTYAHRRCHSNTQNLNEIMSISANKM